MRIRKSPYLLLVTWLIFSLITTAVGGAYATTAYAAESVEEENSLVGGLLLLGLIALIANKGGDSHPADNSPPDGSPPYIPPKPITGLTADEAKMVNLVNQERTSRGLNPLKVNLTLTRVGRAHSQEMADLDYFDHNSPNTGTPFDRMRKAGITYRYAGENLAKNVTVDGAHRALMNSAGHRANILNPNYTEIGVGIVKDGGYLLISEEFIGK